MEPEGASRRGETAFLSAIGFGQVCSWGTLYYSFALMVEAMRTDLGWPKTEIYGAATLGLTLAGLAAYPVGAAIDDNVLDNHLCHACGHAFSIQQD